MKMKELHRMEYNEPSKQNKKESTINPNETLELIENHEIEKHEIENHEIEKINLLVSPSVALRNILNDKFDQRLLTFISNETGIDYLEIRKIARGYSSELSTLIKLGDYLNLKDIINTEINVKDKIYQGRPSWTEQNKVQELIDELEKVRIELGIANMRVFIFQYFSKECNYDRFLKGIKNNKLSTIKYNKISAKLEELKSKIVEK
jgi:hypothetical protein